MLLTQLLSLLLLLLFLTYMFAAVFKKEEPCRKTLSYHGICMEGLRRNESALSGRYEVPMLDKQNTTLAGYFADRIA